MIYFSLAGIQLVADYEAQQRRQLAAYRAEGEINLAKLHKVLEGHASQQAAAHNCRNCGAPPEPVCSYCGTSA